MDTDNFTIKQFKREKRKEDLQRRKALKQEQLKRMCDVIMNLYFMVNEQFNNNMPSA